MAAAAFAGGLAEALFLITVTRAAFAITDGKERVGIVSNWFLSVNQTLLLALGLILVRLALAAFASWHSARLTSSVVAEVRARLAAAFLDASWEIQQSQRGGSLQELLTSYSNQASFLMGSFSQGVLATANLVALIGMAVAVDPLGAAVLVISVGVLGLLLRPMRRAVRRRARDAASAGMDFATSVNEVSDLGMELHVFHVQRPVESKVANLIERARQRTVRLQFVQGLTAPLYTGLAYLALLGALALVATSDATSLTSLGASMLVMLRSLSYGQALQSAHTNVSSSVPAIEELQRQLEVFETGRRRDGGQHIESVGELRAENLWFAYPEGPPVLRDISFSIRSREIVGIVGPSGGGKSTLVELLLGLRDPDRGRVLLNGEDIGRFAKAELARKITFVPQAAHLISGSVADNIRFLREGVTQANVEQAARLAHVHDDICAFVDGYEHPVGERGSHLSGGQQQRLCIARALVEQPDVLILDEPTSALDVRSEHLIRTTLQGLKERMTVIVIAHRLSTLDMCDRIMVIQAGEMRGFDTPTNLEQSSDFYREALILSGLR
jgi:ABC-type multidrug transport system fused ATPase/permease subunit